MKKRGKSKLQLIGSSFVIISGIFVIITTTTNITGRVIESSEAFPKTEMLSILWGILTTIAGIWIIRKKDFNESVFD